MCSGAVRCLTRRPSVGVGVRELMVGRDRTRVWLCECVYVFLRVWLMVAVGVTMYGWGISRVWVCMRGYVLCDYCSNHKPSFGSTS